MGLGGAIGGIIGGIGSYLGARQQAKSAEKQQKNQIKQLNAAASGLRTDYQSVINDILRDPGSYAGQRVQAALYNPVSLSGSLRGTVNANLGNLGLIDQLVGATNRSTLANDFARINAFSPGALGSLGNMGRNAQALTAGQLPADVIQNIISNRSSSAAANGTPGGSGSATLRDLGLSSLDAMNQGASLFQQILQGAEAISPISRQLSSAQFQFTPQQGLQTDLQQALTTQQSQQNAYNLAATPDPAKAMEAQLRLQMANNTASTKAGIAGLPQAPVMPYAQIYGQLGNALGQGLGALFGGGGGGGGFFGGGGGGFDSGFGGGFGGFNASSYNAYAQNYNQNNSGAPPKAYVVY